MLTSYVFDLLMKQGVMEDLINECVVWSYDQTLTSTDLIFMYDFFGVACHRSYRVRQYIQRFYPEFYTSCQVQALKRGLYL